MQARRSNSDILNRLSKVREGFGFCRLHELPRGVPGNPDDCVYQRALRDIDPTMKVGATEIEVKREIAPQLARVLKTRIRRSDKPGRMLVALTQRDANFIAGFDALRYQDLVDEAEYIVQSAAQQHELVGV